MPPPEATIVASARRRVKPCLRKASARNKLERIRKTTGLEKVSKATGVVAIPSATCATGTIRAAMGRETGSKAKMLPVKTNNANAR